MGEKSTTVPTSKRDSGVEGLRLHRLACQADGPFARFAQSVGSGTCENRDSQKPGTDDAEPELGAGLGIGRNAARIVVDCASDQART